MKQAKYLIILLAVTIAASAQCVDLNNPATWAGKLHNTSNSSFIIQDDITLCAGNYVTDTVDELFIFNGSYTLDCGGSTITNTGIATAVLNVYNDTRVSNCVFNEFGTGIMSEQLVEQTPTIEWNQTIAPVSYGRYATVDQEGYYLLVGQDNVPGNNEWRIQKYDINGNTIWTRQYDLSLSGEAALSVTADHNGDYAITGSDGSPGNYQWRVIKISSNGNILWNWTQNPSPNTDVPYSIDVDREGNYVVSGNDAIFGAGNTEWRVVKIDTNGNTIWNWTLNPSSTTDEPHEAAIDQNDNIFPGGLVNGSGNGGLQMIVKISPTGATVWNWTNNPDGRGNTLIEGVAIDHEGYVIGVGARSQPAPRPQNIKEWELVKLDQNGNQILNWTLAFTSGAAATGDLARDVAIDTDGNYVITGAQESAGFLQIQWSAVKVTKNGTTLWNWTFPVVPAGVSIAEAVVVDKQGNYLIAGTDDVPRAQLVKLKTQKKHMSNVTYSNVQIYNTNGHTPVTTPNASVTLNGLTLGYGSTAGKIYYPTINNATGYLSTGWNALFDPYFISINSNETGAATYNTTATITLREANNYGYKLYKLEGFPQNRTAILQNGTVVARSTTAQPTGIVSLQVSGFSGYALTGNPAPQQGGGSNSMGYSSTATTATLQAPAPTNDITTTLRNYGLSVTAMKKNDRITFKTNKETHSITLNSIGEDSVTVTIQSEPLTITLQKNKPKKITLDGEEYEITLTELIDDKATITVTKIEKKTETLPKKQYPKQIAEKETQYVQQEYQQQIPVVEPKKTSTIPILVTLIILAVVSIIAALLLWKPKQKHRRKHK